MRDFSVNDPNLRTVDGIPSRDGSEWAVGSLCDVYCHDQRRWIDGEVVGTFSLDRAQWVRVRYGPRMRDILCGDHDLRARSAVSDQVISVQIPAEQLLNLKNATTAHPALSAVFQNVQSEAPPVSKSCVSLKIRKLTSFGLDVVC